MDIGGTNIVAAVVASQDAHVLSRASIPTEPERGPDVGIRRVGDLIAQVIRDSGLPIDQIGGVGIGCTGPIDSVNGTVHNPYTLPTWDGMPLTSPITERFGLPALLLHDCAAAALGEHWVGAGQGARHMIYVTVGTGIGAGLILDGQLHRGVGLLAGEVGHQVIDLNGPPCYCGARGCWEMLAAAPAIAKLGAERASPGGLLLEMAAGDRSRITPKLIAEAAEAGDPDARAIINRVAFYIGVGIANLMNVLAPEVVVLGGGVMQSWPLMAQTLQATIDERSGMIPFEQIKVLPARLRLNAGVIGAARGLLNHLAGQI
jgi:glucokinase